MKKYLKFIPTLMLVIGLGGLAVSCDTGGDDNDNATHADENTGSRALERYSESQPPPEFDWSQLRQNLIEISTAQAQTTQTTTFFFNMGVAEPIGECPSIGFPIPATAQLTNPQQVVQEGSRERGTVTIPLIEQTGVYTGDTSGTYVMCVNGEGEAYAVYWEGFVQTLTGSASFTDGEVDLVGTPTFNFSETEG